MKKKLLNLALAFALIMSTAIGLVACGKKDDSQDNKSNALTYVNLDINPEIELIVDSDNKVVSVRAKNDDGLILLFESTGIEGETIEKAIDKILTLAKNYGYIDETNNVIGTIISSSDESLENSIKNKINSTISATAKNLGITISTDTEGAYSLLRKYNEFKASHPDNTAIQNLNITKFKLALAVSENGEISLETAVTLDDEKLINMILQISANTEEYATMAFKKAKADAYALYNQGVEIHTYYVYSDYYIQNILSHPLTAYYGVTYSMYATYAKALESICEAVEIASSVDDYVINTSQINISEVTIALGISDEDVIKNSDGEITIKSIEEYADKYFKNAQASADLEQKKTELTTALNKIEASIKLKVQAFADNYKSNLEEIVNKANNTLTATKQHLNNLPNTLQTLINDIVSDINEAVEEVTNMTAKDGHIDTQKLREITIKLKTKANEYLEKIKNDIGETKFAELEQKRINKANEFTSFKTSLENSLNSAARDAKKQIRDWKNTLISSLPTE